MLKVKDKKNLGGENNLTEVLTKVVQVVKQELKDDSGRSIGKVSIQLTPIVLYEANLVITPEGEEE